MTAEELLLHLSLEATICDHRGDMVNSLCRAYKVLGLKEPEIDDDGYFDVAALKARGAQYFHEMDDS